MPRPPRPPPRPLLPGGRSCPAGRRRLAALLGALGLAAGGPKAALAAEPRRGPASPEYAWLLGTVWDWNRWRHVTFHEDGRFEAPTDDCEEGRCTWRATARKNIEIRWGDAGLHVLTASEDHRELAGERVEDGSPCSATLVKSLPKDPYNVLGVDRTASQKDIKQAYRKLSLKHHPDKGGDDPALFNEIQEAYEQLSDPDKREVYDSGGGHRFEDREDWLAAVHRGEVSVSKGFYGGSEAVETLTGRNFHGFTSARLPALVEFYAPWCSHCQDFVSEFKRAGAMLDGQVRLGAVNCEDQTSICEDLGVHSFPQLLFFKDGESVPFQGEEPTAESLRSFALSLAVDLVVPLSSARLKREVGKGSIWLVDFSAGPWCGPCARAKFALQQSAASLQELGVKVGIVDCDKAQELCEELSVPHFPQVRVFRKDEDWRSGGTPLEMEEGEDMPQVLAIKLFAAIARVLLPPSGGGGVELRGDRAEL